MDVEAPITERPIGERVAVLEQWKVDIDRRMEVLESQLARIYGLGWVILGSSVLVPIVLHFWK